MTEVFLLTEASMRAYQMVGWRRPESKVWFENIYGSVALEAAIIMMALVENEDDEYGIEQVAEEPVFKRWVSLLHKSSKFRDAIKKNSARLIAHKKSQPGEGWAWAEIGQMAQEHLTEPENYAGETVLELEGGWKWVRLTDEVCRDYEGAEMQHCGRATGEMYSLRDPQGRPHVTMDVSPEPDGVDDGPVNIPPGDIIQLRGKQNSIPDIKYWAKIRPMVQQVGAEDLWDSYTDPNEPEDQRGLQLSRNLADSMGIGWAHDPDNFSLDQPQGM